MYQFGSLLQRIYFLSAYKNSNIMSRLVIVVSVDCGACNRSQLMAVL